MKWCRAEIAEGTPPPPRARSLFVPAIYVLFAHLDEFLRRERLDLTDVFPRPTEDLTKDEIEQRIATAYRKLAGDSHDWVGLVDLRPMLGRIAAKEVDAVLDELSSAGRISLVPESNRKALTLADHEAAVRIGGEEYHLIAIEAS